MRNVPSFDEFLKYNSLFENASQDLIEEFKFLEKSSRSYEINEGKALDSIKSSLSKFLLGPLSKTGMIDDTRKIMLELEIDLIEQIDNIRDQIDEISDQINSLSRSSDRDRILALSKDKDLKIKEIEAYTKTQKLKIKRCLDHVKNLIGDSERRREYYEVGRSEDEITIAEMEYRLAKDKADRSEIKKYEEKIQKARKEAEEKTEDFNASIKDERELDSDKKTERVDLYSEKKKISSRKGYDILKRKNELEKEISDLKYEILSKLRTLQKKGDKVTSNYINKIRIQLLELSSNLDSKMNLLNLFNSLGDSEKNITSKISKEDEFTRLSDKINKGIIDGQDANTGTKKEISSIFVELDKNGKGKIKPEKIKDVIKKIEK